MRKIFPKIYLKLYSNVTKQMNSNKYYITASRIPCNIYSYSYVITITVYQTCSKNIKKVDYL